MPRSSLQSEYDAYAKFTHRRIGNLDDKKDRQRIRSELGAQLVRDIDIKYTYNYFTHQSRNSMGHGPYRKVHRSVIATILFLQLWHADHGMNTMTRSSCYRAVKEVGHTVSLLAVERFEMVLCELLGLGPNENTADIIAKDVHGRYRVYLQRRHIILMTQSLIVLESVMDGCDGAWHLTHTTLEVIENDSSGSVLECYDKSTGPTPCNLSCLQDKPWSGLMFID